MRLRIDQRTPRVREPFRRSCFSARRSHASDQGNRYTKRFTMKRPEPLHGSDCFSVRNGASRGFVARGGTLVPAACWRWAILRAFASWTDARNSGDCAEYEELRVMSPMIAEAEESVKTHYAFLFASAQGQVAKWVNSLTFVGGCHAPNQTNN